MFPNLARTKLSTSSRSINLPVGRKVRALAFRNQPVTCGLGGGGGMGGNGRRLCATGGSGGPSEPSGPWAKYLELLESHPFVTRAVTCGVLNGLGDIVSQVFIEGSSFELSRTLTFTCLGLFFVGPVLFYWYGWLGGLIPGSGAMSVLGSLALDQLLFAPPFIAAFMSILTVTIEGPTHLKDGSLQTLKNSIASKIQKDWPPAVQVNWLLWVPAQFINFKFVPPNLRVLAVNVTALIWNIYMSYQGHKKVAEA
ncbi:hypothetical protein CEUSTIGMA_g12867.t1 [Chlamydomonas eustigma]|uniref:Peroxisomal membrane protein MPV17 n=1 Tax=Chlamydomonas eustigma TaxID=1157962 RepID=A0A250XQU6_9CHLO|nr:hypothetical protein CEUSTIGMA_g12867.t1 [Chlamydomonas eustigma]|eukprot:GAX85451.1 hypothetical protein CEUSTIGMA_g12867.t1 [Chlamydomonas eustigma]